MKLLIVDDEKTCCDQVKRILEIYSEKKNLPMSIRAYSGSQEMFSGQQSDAPDVIFLDICLEEENGIHVAKEINRRWKDCQIVFLTNYLYYATDIFDTVHTYFVLKDQLERRLDQVFEKIMHQRLQAERQLHFHAMRGSAVSLFPKEIVYFERAHRMTKIVTVSDIYEIHESISEIQEQLENTDFVRCHNSFLIYLPAVREMRKTEFLMKNGDVVLISRGYGKHVKEAFANWAFTQLS